MRYTLYVGHHRETLVTGAGIFKQGEKTEITDAQFLILSKLSQFKIIDDTLETKVETENTEIVSKKKNRKKKETINLEDTDYGSI